MKEVKTVYFLGIGGIGMSALARFFKKQGAAVFGYDRTATPLTAALEREGMFIHYQEDIAAIPSKPDLVIYTPAIPKDNKEYLYFVSNGVELKKRAEVLGLLSKEYFTVAVAGTHGKTSISSMAAHMLKSAGRNLTALIGGILKNYQSNFILSETTDILLVEADEYDRSFLQLSPDISVISSIDADHLDIYGSKEELRDNFHLFVDRLSKQGVLIYHNSLAELKSSAEKTIGYSARSKAMCEAENVRVEKGNFVFDLRYGENVMNAISLAVPGLHYVENALAAAAIGFEIGLAPAEIKSGLESFNGVLRRFDYHIKSDDMIFIDDYAHHPKELEVTIEAVNTLYPDKKITGVFQPHLFSRTNDFADGFATALDNLDEVILLDIYPAREKPMAGVTSEMILNRMKNSNKKLMKKDELLQYFRQSKPEVLITLGAGDIGLMLDDIEQVLKNNN